MTITRSTASRRARNSASDRIGARRRPASRPSRRRSFLASRRVEPRTAVTSPSTRGGVRTRVTVCSGSSAAAPLSSPRRRRRRRRRVPIPSPTGSLPAAVVAGRPSRARPGSARRPRRPRRPHRSPGPAACHGRAGPGRRAAGRRRRAADVSSESSAHPPAAVSIRLVLVLDLIEVGGRGIGDGRRGPPGPSAGARPVGGNRCVVLRRSLERGHGFDGGRAAPPARCGRGRHGRGLEQHGGRRRHRRRLVVLGRLVRPGRGHPGTCAAGARGGLRRLESARRLGRIGFCLGDLLAGAPGSGRGPGGRRGIPDRLGPDRLGPDRLGRGLAGTRPSGVFGAVASAAEATDRLAGASSGSAGGPAGRPAARRRRVGLAAASAGCGSAVSGCSVGSSSSMSGVCRSDPRALDCQATREPCIGPPRADGPHRAEIWGSAPPTMRRGCRAGSSCAIGYQVRSRSAQLAGLQAAPVAALDRIGKCRGERRTPGSSRRLPISRPGPRPARAARP